MKTLFKWIHIIFLTLFVITGNDIYDKILGGIISVIAYIYAYSFTGNISDELGFKTHLMSLIHWIVRTVVSVLMIFVSRLVYLGLISVLKESLDYGVEVVSIITCTCIWIVIAELYKSVTGLRKSY